MPDRQFPAKQAERDEYSVAEESHITSRQPASVRGGARQENADEASERGKEESIKSRRETRNALLAAVSRVYLKKHGEHRDKNAAMTVEKNTEGQTRPRYACGLN